MKKTATVATKSGKAKVVTMTEDAYMVVQALSSVRNSLRCLDLLIPMPGVDEQDLDLVRYTLTGMCSDLEARLAVKG